MDRMKYCLALLALANATSYGAHAQSVRSDSGSCERPLANVITRCESLDVGGRYQVRSIVTRPATAPAGRLPAILFVQWLSCDPITVAPDVNDGWNNVLRDLIQRSGFVVTRTEKPGIAGSGGPSCSVLGYDEELNVHRHALEQLKRSPDVHPDSVFVFGASMGGTMAPLLAAVGGVRGVIVAGTTGVTWLEHMIALDRRVMELRELSADSIHEMMSDHIRFQSRYLGQQQTPASIIAEWPQARSVWRRMIGTDSLLLAHYGRSIRFHHEAQQQNWANAWERVSAPVLAIHGENDWIMADFEQAALVRALRSNAGTRYVNVPGMGHDFLTYGSLAQSFRSENGRFDPSVSRTILDWLEAQRRRR